MIKLRKVLDVPNEIKVVTFSDENYSNLLLGMVTCPLTVNKFYDNIVNLMSEYEQDVAYIDHVGHGVYQVLPNPKTVTEYIQRDNLGMTFEELFTPCNADIADRVLQNMLSDKKILDQDTLTSISAMAATQMMIEIIDRERKGTLGSE